MNRVVLVGRLTKDAETKKTASGISVSKFTLAVDRQYKKEGEQTADFINCVAWRQSADFIGRYGTKGAMIAADGRIQTGSYEQDGRKIYTTDVVVDNLQILSKPEGAKAEPKQATAYSAPILKHEEFGIDSDDLPF